MKDTLAFSHALLSMTLQGHLFVSVLHLHLLCMFPGFMKTIYSFRRVSRYIKIKSNMEILAYKVSLINFFQVKY